MNGENRWHTIIVMTNYKSNGEPKLSDLSRSADACAHDVPKDLRSRDVRMTSVRFDDVVHTLEVRPYSEQYEELLNIFVFGKYGVYITISRRACAYTGLTKDELTTRRINMAKIGRWKKSALRRHIVLQIANAKARSYRSAISLAVPSRRAPLSPLASVPLCVTTTKAVKVKGGKR